MPGYTVFDADTGKILRSGSCSQGDLHLQANGSNEIVIEGEYRDDQFKIAFTEKGASPRKRRARKENN